MSKRTKLTDRKGRKSRKTALSRNSAWYPEQLFMKSSTPEAKMSALKMLADSRQKTSFDRNHKLGAMSLEIAMSKELPSDDRLSHLDQAYSALRTSVKDNNSEQDTLKYMSLKYLYQINVFKELITDNRPSRSSLDESYKYVINGILGMLDYRGKNKFDESRADENKTTTGMLAEYCTLALLRRFEDQHLKDASWLAIPSLYSEDNSPPGNSLRKNWDVSGLIAPDDNIPDYDLVYRIQVKNGHAYHPYSSKIALVNTMHDIGRPDHSESPLSATDYIAQSLVDEYFGEASRYQENFLDHATDLLLDKIDE